MSDKVSPWHLGGLTLWQLSKRVWQEYGEDEIGDRAASLSYYFLFALFPSLLFLAALLGMLPIPGLMERLMGYVRETLPGDASSVIEKTLAEIVRGSRGSLVSIGVLIALWSGSNGMGSVIVALNVAYDVKDARPWVLRRLLAIGLTFGFSLFILGALILMVFGPKLGGVVTGALGLGALFTAVWNVANVPLAMLFVLVGIALVYYLAPAAQQQWRWVTPGSVVALGLWLAMSFGLRLYVKQFANYNATYGSIGGVILLMLWLYLTGIALLLGAEVNSEIEHAAARRGEPTAKLSGEVAPGERAPKEHAA
ncbi:MAG: YihY/virulence factor BrkB family protein [Actinobacteria bacterium]|nr:MAG: YihY/virulence factor BrkB family protein [Actinomycetota bacterium]